MPEVSQLYTLHSNKIRGSKDAVLFKTKGAKVPAPVLVTEQVEQEQRSLGENSSRLEPYIADGFVAPTCPASRVRLSELRCFLCHQKLGSDHSNRIGTPIS